MEKELEFIKVSAVLHAYEFARWRLILYSCATTAILNEYNINNITTNKVEGVCFLLKTQFRDLFCMAVALWNKYHFLHSTLFSLSVPFARLLARSRARVFLLLLLERKRLWSWSERMQRRQRCKFQVL
jgi:hypothetical protein